MVPVRGGRAEGGSVTKSEIKAFVKGLRSYLKLGNAAQDHVRNWALLVVVGEEPVVSQALNHLSRLLDDQDES